MCHRPIVKVFLRHLHFSFKHPQVLLLTTAHQYFTREWCIKCATFKWRCCIEFWWLLHAAVTEILWRWRVDTAWSRL